MGWVKVPEEEDTKVGGRLVGGLSEEGERESGERSDQDTLYTQQNYQRKN